MYVFKYVCKCVTQWSIGLACLVYDQTDCEIEPDKHTHCNVTKQNLGQQKQGSEWQFTGQEPRTLGFIHRQLKGQRARNEPYF